MSYIRLILTMISSCLTRIWSESTVTVISTTDLILRLSPYPQTSPTYSLPHTFWN